MNSRPELGKVTVGQVLIVKPAAYNRPVNPVRVNVTKAGRVWVDLAEESPDRFPRTWRLRLDTQDAGSSYAHQDRFVSQEQYAWDLEQCAAKEVLRAARIDTNPGWKGGRWNSGDRLLALAAFVEKYDADHPEVAE